MAVHAGEAHERQADYFGPTVNRAARLMAAADGGQFLVSSSVASSWKSASSCVTYEHGLVT